MWCTLTAFRVLWGGQYMSKKIVIEEHEIGTNLRGSCALRNNCHRCSNLGKKRGLKPQLALSFILTHTLLPRSFSFSLSLSFKLLFWL